VAKVGTSKAGGTIIQHAVVYPWLAADAHGNKQTNKQTKKTQPYILTFTLFGFLENLTNLPSYLSYQSGIHFQLA
jgi:hypothetical protein